MKKTILLSAAVMMLCSCSGNKTNESASAQDETANVRLDSVGLQGEWRLSSYRVDCASVELADSTDYLLAFNEPDNTFGLTTDCNTIGGEFGVTNDTIRFHNMMVTEMACHDMTVEQNMLRMLNDTTAYATYSADTLTLAAPQIGNARFVRR